MPQQQEAFKDQILSQVHRAISAEFPSHLGMTSNQYVNEVMTLLAQLKEPSIPVDMVTLVEPRIPFDLQLKLLGIERDPALFQEPHDCRKVPEIVYQKVLNRSNPLLAGKSLGELTEPFEGGYKLASPYEGLLQADRLAQFGFVAFLGGEYTRPHGLQTGLNKVYRYPYLTDYLGRKRMTCVYPESKDGLIGVMTTVPS